MNETQIKEQLKDCIIFNGVFPSDLHCLPLIQHYPYGIISNTDPHYMDGKHWIAMYFHKNKIVEYFDSFGLKPFIESHITYMSIYADNVIYNNKQVQNIFSSTCGEHCVYYMKQKCKGFSLNKIIKTYSQNCNENDNYVYNLIH